MKRTPYLISLTVTALALLGLAHPRPCPAQQTTLDLVPFKAVVQQTPLNTPVAIIPGTTPLAVSIIKMTGTADYMGAVSYIELHPGDEIYFTYHGVVHPTATGADAEFAFTVTGGKGRFAGATGSGLVKGGVDRPNNTVTIAIDAMITRPKP
jgi:hypothetical protein